MQERRIIQWMSYGRQPLLSFLLASLLLVAAAFLHPSEQYPSSIWEGYDFPQDAENIAPDISEVTPEDAEEVPPLPAPTEDLALTQETASGPSWLEYKIRRGDTMSRILPKIHASQEAEQFLLSQKLKSYKKLRRGERLQFQLDDSGNLSALLYKTSPSYYLRAGRDENGIWWAEEKPPILLTVTQKKGGRINSSLFAAADRAGFSNLALDSLIETLETQIDFYRDTREGDTFRAIYEETQDKDGKIIGSGKLLAFEYVSLRRGVNKPRTIRGAWNAAEKSYFSPNGDGMQGAFLRAPLKFRRISSRFSHRRFHPVLKRWRPHRGVDYAAPSGTPVRATADGVITKIATQRGYGKVIMISHFDIYTTVYAHLRGFAKGMRKGRKVNQGDVIGYVGQTGLATGPHLHYEFRVRGKHKNPLSADIPRQMPPLKGKTLENFQAQAASLFAQLDMIKV